MLTQTLASKEVLNSEFQETLHAEWGQRFSVNKKIFEEKSEFWDLVIFENNRFGRVLAIDGAVQLTEVDEPIYHEMMVHVPLLSHGNVKSVLIIGGGDGGALREVLRHPSVERAVLVEIDPTVIELSKKYFPSISKGAFEHPKAEIIIQDAAQYIEETKETFDVIICDSCDPEGPALVLFSSKFYGNCKAKLNKGGIFVNQNGIPFLQKEEMQMTLTNRAPHFKHVSFFLASVPTYIGGFLAIGWASDEEYAIHEEILQQRMNKLTGDMLYYTPAIHKASFALPKYMLSSSS